MKKFLLALAIGVSGVTLVAPIDLTFSSNFAKGVLAIGGKRLK